MAMSEEQSLLQDALAGFLTDHLNHEKRASLIGTGKTSMMALWRRLGKDLGVFGVGFPEEIGGTGGSVADQMVVMDAFGEHLAPLPFLETVILGSRLLLKSEQPGARLMISQLIAGDAVVAFAYAEAQSRDSWYDVMTTATQGQQQMSLNGRKIMVYFAPLASHLIVTARTGGGHRDTQGISLFLIEKDRPGVSVRDYQLIDGSVAGDVLFDNVVVSEADLLGTRDEAGPLIEQVLLNAAAAVCAEAVGCMRAMLNQTADYSRQRVQYGVPISSFQALQHRMADMYMKLQHATSFAEAAAQSLDNPGQARWMIPAAKAYIGKAGRFVGYSAVQIHGGVGLMEATPVAQFFKRMKVIEGQYGSTDHHLSRFVAKAGISVPPDRILTSLAAANSLGDAR